MATPDHTPEGRGYDQSLIYFHHANDYWQYTCGSCAAAGAQVSETNSAYTEQELLELNVAPEPVVPGTCPSTFNIVPETGICKSAGHDMWHGPVESQEDCCAKCAEAPGCVGWTYQYLNSSSCFICNATQGGPTVGRTSGCLRGGAACDYSDAVTDLWSGASPAHAMRPPAACVAESSVANNSKGPWPSNSSCIYEDALFESEVRKIIATHPLPQPLFLL